MDQKSSGSWKKVGDDLAKCADDLAQEAQSMAREAEAMERELHQSIDLGDGFRAEMTVTPASGEGRISVQPPYLASPQVLARAFTLINLPGGTWVRINNSGRQRLTRWQRVRAAWAVLRGRADAFTWD